MYNVDYKRLAMHLLPTFLRQPCIFGILRAALVPLENLHARFIAKRKAQLYRVTHNGQVCYLTAALNDTFPSSIARFSILSVERKGDWLYAVSEGGTDIPLAAEEVVRELHVEVVGTNPTRRRFYYENVGGEDVPIVWSEYLLNAVQNSFVVLVPTDIYNTPTQLEAVKALVNTYKLVTKYAIYTPTSGGAL